MPPRAAPPGKESIMNPSTELTQSLRAKAKASALQPFTAIPQTQGAGPRVIVRGKGMRVWDSDGNEYLDMMAGLWCVDIGYGREEMADAISDQVKTLCYYTSFQNNANQPSLELADKLASLTPGNLNKVFFGLSGSDCNDTNVKIVWYYNNLLGRPERKKIISRKMGYHGVTVASASMTGLPPLHLQFDVPLASGRFVHVSKPHYFLNAPAGMSELDYSASLAKELEETILREGPETVAAFIAEPVMGACGVVPPPQGYFEAIIPVVRKYGLLFIADEVICGFGRLGTWFGSNYYNLQPDIMTLAKGLTSGYVPMAASVVSDEIWDVLHKGAAEVGPFSHGFTYSCHPVAAAAGLKNLEIFERENLVDNARDVGAYFQAQLDAHIAPHPLVGEKRGLGNVAAVELYKNRATKEPFPPKPGVAVRAAEIAASMGLIFRPVVNICIFSPPHIISRADVDEAVEKLKKTLDILADELKKSGDWQG